MLCFVQINNKCKSRQIRKSVGAECVRVTQRGPKDKQTKWRFFSVLHD